MKKVIVFVCKGNIHRSVVAEIYLKHLLAQDNLLDAIEVTSCGTQESPTQHANLTEYEREWLASEPSLRELGVDIEQLRQKKACRINTALLDRATIVVAMSAEIESDVKSRFPQHAAKIILFDSLSDAPKICPDCFKQSKDAYESVNRTIVATLQQGYRQLLR